MRDRKECSVKLTISIAGCEQLYSSEEYNSCPSVHKIYRVFSLVKGKNIEETRQLGDCHPTSSIEFFKLLTNHIIIANYKTQTQRKTNQA